MQNPVYQDQQEKKQNGKNPKIRIFQGICLGFLPASFRSKNKTKIHQRHLLTLNENKKEKNLLSEIHSDSYMKDFGAMALS